MASALPSSSESFRDPIPDLRSPSLYANRELSLLEFHRRVIAQATDPTIPLLERLRFLTISSSILDEFFEIRVAGLKEQVAFGLPKPGADGLSAGDVLRRIRHAVAVLVESQYQALNDSLIPELAREGVVIQMRTDWTPEQRAWIAEYFRREVEPVLSPVGLDPAHPFPKILNKSLNFIVTLSGRDAFGRSGRVAVIQAPRLLPRVLKLPDSISQSANCFVLLSSIITEHVDQLFPGMKVVAAHQFRVTRNSDLWVEEEEVHDLLSALKGELPRRHYGKAVRLEVSTRCTDEVVQFLLQQFELEPDDCYRVAGPVNLHRIEAIYEAVDRPDLRYPAMIPQLPKKLQATTDLFATLRERDLLLHHPYQSFTPVVDLLEQAASDPDVLAIKLTIYRTGLDSPLASALLRAANSGKEVTAIVELRARFDEAANIALASRLQEAGVKVAYGIVGYKAHCKMLMIVRREGEHLRRYCHLGTGNYNAKTARLYTDFGLLTADEAVGEDVSRLFLQLTGLGKAGRLNRLIQTPFSLKTALIEWIDAEAQQARKKKPARIMAKVNSLSDPDVIEALYRASQAGVSIDLIVRGVCCLIPGIAGVSENIRVRSIVGRFLEHHRVFYFHNKGKPRVLAGSADWMVRNLSRRVEVCFPVESKKLRQRLVREGLEIYLEDNSTAWTMRSDGGYERCTPGPNDPKISAQESLLAELSAPTARPNK